VHPVDIADFLTTGISPMASDTQIANWLGALRAFFDFLCLGGAGTAFLPVSCICGLGFESCHEL